MLLTTVNFDRALNSIYIYIIWYLFELTNGKKSVQEFFFIFDKVNSMWFETFMCKIECAAIKCAMKNQIDIFQMNSYWIFLNFDHTVYHTYIVHTFLLLDILRFYQICHTFMQNCNNNNNKKRERKTNPKKKEKFGMEMQKCLVLKTKTICQRN